MSETDVQRLLEAFIAEDRGDQPADPQRYLEQVEGVDRAELAALIDGYLARAPRRRVAGRIRPGAAGGPSAAADRIERAVFGEAGTWPVLLPRLRERARIARRELVAKLAQAIGTPGEVDRVADYYHRMEHGLLPAAGVSDRVLEALGALLREAPEKLRAAGAAIAPLRGEPPTVAYARTATPDEELAAKTAAPPQDDDRSDAPQPGGDLVDRLFTGGRDAGRDGGLGEDRH